MSQFRLVFTKSATKDIHKIDTQIRIRIKKKILFFVESSEPLKFAERLTKPADAQYRWRVGSYRILFDQEDDTITILHIQHRREVYK